MSKIPNVVLLGPLGRKSREKFENLRLRFVGGSSVLKCSLPQGLMLTKTKNIRKKKKKKFSQKFNQHPSVWPRGSQCKPQLKFERITCIRFRDNCDTDGQTNFDFMSSADIQSSTAKNGEARTVVLYTQALGTLSKKVILQKGFFQSIYMII